MRASTSSLPVVVDNTGLEIVLLPLLLSFDTVASIVMPELEAIAVKFNPVTLFPVIVTV